MLNTLISCESAFHTCLSSFAGVQNIRMIPTNLRCRCLGTGFTSAVRPCVFDPPEIISSCLADGNCLLFVGSSVPHLDRTPGPQCWWRWLMLYIGIPRIFVTDKTNGACMSGHLCVDCTSNSVSPCSLLRTVWRITHTSPSRFDTRFISSCKLACN